MALFPVVQSGFICSSGFALEKPDRPFSILVPSYAAMALYVQFAQTAETSAVSADFFTLFRSDATGGVYTVYSGAGALNQAATAPVTPVTPWVRLLAGATAAFPRSFTVIPVQQA